MNVISSYVFSVYGGFYVWRIYSISAGGIGGIIMQIYMKSERNVT